MANEMNGMMNGQMMMNGTPMMGTPVQQMMPQAPVQQQMMQPQAAYTAPVQTQPTQQMPAQSQEVKINTNMCKDGDRAVVKGKLGFSYYLTHPKIGETLAEDIKRQRMNGLKFINERPRFEATITEPEIVFSDGRTAAQATMLEQYLVQKKFYTDKNGVMRMDFEKVINPEKVQLPAFKMRGTGEKLTLANQHLAEGQTVYITFEIKDSNKGNKGCYVRLVEFEEEPKFFVPDNEYGEAWTPDTTQQTAPTTPAAPVSQPQPQAQMPVNGGWGVPQTQMPVQQPQMQMQPQTAYTAQPQAPVQTAPIGDGFAPAPEGAVYQEASFWQ